MEDVRYHSSGYFLKFFNFNTLSLQERPTVEFQRISLIGFRSCTSPFLCPDTLVRLPMDIRLKIDLGKSVDFVMSDLEDSTVTYTEAPPSPDYVPGPEHPPSPVYVPYVPELVYPEFMLPKDDVLPAEEQLLPAAVSSIADSPGYITEFDLEEYPEEDDEDPEDDPADYPTNRDDDVEEEEESSGDDADDEDKDEDKEEEEHIALTDFVPPPTCRTTARMSIQDQTPIPFLSATKIPSTPLPVSSPLPVSPPSLPASPTYPLGYRAAMIRLRAQSPSTSHILPLPSPIILPHTRAFVVMIRAAAPSTYIFASRLETPPSGTPPLLPIPLPTPSLPLLLPSTFYREGVSEGILAATDVAGLSQRMTYFVTTVRQDTNEIYGRLDDAQDDRSLISGQLNMLHKDRRAHACTARLMESEARLSREAWVQSMDASDTACSEVRALQTTVLAQQSETGDLRATDRRR
ncbi:hypothetical protein Tco_0611466 [Tanacetum coccineum]